MIFSFKYSLEISRMTKSGKNTQKRTCLLMLLHGYKFVATNKILFWNESHHLKVDLVCDKITYNLIIR